MAYTPRPGSTGDQVLQIIRARGPTAGSVLAAELDQSETGLANLLAWAMSKGGIKRHVHGDEWIYSEGDGVEAAAAPVAPAAPPVRGPATPPAKPAMPRADIPRSVRLLDEAFTQHEREQAARPPLPAADPDKPLRLCIWSDGRLEIHRGLDEFALDKAETLQLVHFLRCALGEEGAAA